MLHVNECLFLYYNHEDFEAELADWNKWPYHDNFLERSYWLTNRIICIT